MWGDLHCRLLPQVQGIVRNDDVSIDAYKMEFTQNPTISYNKYTTSGYLCDITVESRLRP